MSKDQIKAEYVKFLSKVLPKQYSNKIIDRLTTTQVGDWLLDATAEFVMAVSQQAIAEVMKERT